MWPALSSQPCDWYLCMRPVLQDDGRVRSFQGTAIPPPGLCASACDAAGFSKQSDPFAHVMLQGSAHIWTCAHALPRQKAGHARACAHGPGARGTLPPSAGCGAACPHWAALHASMRAAGASPWPPPASAGQPGCAAASAAPPAPRGAEPLGLQRLCAWGREPQPGVAPQHASVLAHRRVACARCATAAPIAAGLLRVHPPAQHFLNHISEAAACTAYSLMLYMMAQICAQKLGARIRQHLLRTSKLLELQEECAIAAHRITRTVPRTCGAAAQRDSVPEHTGSTVRAHREQAARERGLRSGQPRLVAPLERRCALLPLRGLPGRLQPLPAPRAAATCAAVPCSISLLSCRPARWDQTGTFCN